MHVKAEHMRYSPGPLDEFKVGDAGSYIFERTSELKQRHLEMHVLVVTGEIAEAVLNMVGLTSGMVHNKVFVCVADNDDDDEGFSGNLFVYRHDGQWNLIRVF